jgi:TonB family protein
MMRSSIVAALVLSPLVLSSSMVRAQANSSAQLQSSSAQPKGLMLSAAAATSPAKSGVRISTGVVAPKLVKTVQINDDGSRISQLFPGNREVVVAMIVDATGKPSGLKIVKSAGDSMDKNVLAAVSEYRFQPGTVSGQAVEFPLNLDIEIQK